MGLMSTGGYLLMGGGALVLAGTTLLGTSAVIGLGPAPSPGTTASPSASVAPVTLDGCAETVDYSQTTEKILAFRYALAADQGVSDPADHMDDVYGALKDLTCKNPVVAGAFLAADQGDFSSLNERPGNLVADRTVWRGELRTALEHFKAASPQIVDVDAGSWTLAAYPESGLDEDVPVSIRQKKTPDDYHAVMYQVGNHTVRLLLEGGFSPVQAVRFDGVDGIPKTPKAPASPSATPSASRSAAASRGSGSSTVSGGSGIVNHDPHHNGYADQGGGTNTGLHGGASAPSGSPPAAPRTNPPRPSPSATSGGGRGAGGSAAHASPSPSAARTAPSPEESAPPSTDPETRCVVVPGVEDCTPLN